MSKAKKKQSRTYGIIIPSEWENAKSIIIKAKSVAKYYYYIEHDRDIYAEDSEFNAKGEFKKKHIHLLFTFNSSRDLSTVCNYFTDFPELKENSFELINNAFGAKRYLVHADDPDKAQYNVLEVETNDKLFANCFIERASKNDMFDNFLNAFDNNASTMREYCEKFRPMAMEMTASQMSYNILQWRREWRLMNEYRETSKKRVWL